MAGVLIEGFAAEELLSWPADKLRELVAVGRPIVFRAGSSTVLAAVQIEERRLIIELAHIDGGGEGVLPTLWRFGQSYARLNSLRRSNGWCTPLDARGPTHGFRRCSKRWGSSSRIFRFEGSFTAG